MKFNDYTPEQQEKIIERARKIQYKIKDRCYNKKFKQYKDYGGAGVTLCDEWHNVYKFARDLVELPGWDYELFVEGELELDKDFLKWGNKVYCKEYCALLTRAENAQYKPSIHKPFYAYNQYTQEIKEHFNAKMFAEENNVSEHVARSVLQGKKHRVGDWYLWYKSSPYPEVYKVYAEKDGHVEWDINPQRLSLKLGLTRTCVASALSRGKVTHGWRVYKKKVDIESLVKEYESNKMPNDYRTVTFCREDKRGNLVEYTFKIQVETQGLSG